MDGGELFAGFLLFTGFLVGALAVLIAGWLMLQKLRQHFRGKSELRQEQARAVAIAEAHVKQDFNDKHVLWQAWLLVRLKNEEDQMSKISRNALQ